jgi:hypothetical protein
MFVNSKSLLLINHDLQAERDPLGCVLLMLSKKCRRGSALIFEAKQTLQSHIIVYELLSGWAHISHSCAHRAQILYSLFYLPRCSSFHTRTLRTKASSVFLYEDASTQTKLAHSK